MMNKYISAPELAKLLGVSRTAVFNRIESGDIHAEKIGRNYAISSKEVSRITQGVLTKEVSEGERKILQSGYKKVIKDFGKTLKLLGKE